MKSGWSLVLGVVMVGGVVTACGGGSKPKAVATTSSTTSTTSTSIATTSSSVAKTSTTAVTKASVTTTSTKAPTTTGASLDVAALTAAAKAINLSATDFSADWTSSPADNSGGSTAEDAQVAACAGAPDPVASTVVDWVSDDFTNQDIDVSSDVNVVKTVQLARQDLAAIRSDKALACFRQLFPGFATKSAPPGSHINIVSVNRLPVASYGDGSFGIRVIFDAGSSAGSVRVTIDQIGFAKGRYEVSGTFAGVNSVFPADLEQSLMAKLVSRTAAAPPTA